MNRLAVMTALERIAAALWVGGLWAVGYLAVPVLFAMLEDRQLAGALAGQIFSLLNIAGLFCAVVLIGVGLVRCGGGWLRSRRGMAVVAMTLLVALSMTVLQPMMQELKAAGLVPGSEAAARFGQLHGLSSVLYLVTSLLGLFVVAGGGVCPRRGSGAD